MKIDKEKLKLLQGLIPCTSSVTFTPEVYSEFKDNEEMVGFIPTFTCGMLTNELASDAKKYSIEYATGIIDKKPILNKKTRILDIIGELITGWTNMYDLSTGKEITYSEDNVDNLPEILVESIFAELMRYAGIMPRGV